MRVGIDISQIAHKGGVSTYTQNLATELVKDKGVDFLFLFASLRKKYSGNLPNVKSIPIPPTIFEAVCSKFRIFSVDFVLPDLSLFHSSDWTQPKTKAKKITTYHDLIPIKFPELSHPKIVAVQKRRLKIVEEEIDAIIAVSENTKKDLMELSNIPESKITVIYEGASDLFKPRSEEEINLFKQKHSLPDKFVLAIGGIGKRKNLERIKEACREKNLVIAGLDIPIVNAEDMNLLYASSEVLLYAPLYEGFGLPILEGFASGTPVVTSNTSSMPEIGGDAATYVDPNNVDEMREKIDMVLGDNQIRKDMINKGLKRAKNFSWEKCAKETLELYKKVLNK